MKFSKGATVKLSPDILLKGVRDCEAFPVWGGMEGAIGGTVVKTYTHEHDPALHTADVDWFNGQKATLTEAQMAYMSSDEVIFSRDWAENKGCLAQDVIVLIRTEAGSFVVNAIESMRAAMPGFSVLASARYAALITKFAVPTISQNDHNLLARMISFSDVKEQRTHTLWMAITKLYEAWGCTLPGNFRLPLPTYKSINEAAECAPADRGTTIAFFHLPNNICEYNIVDGTEPNADKHKSTQPLESAHLHPQFCGE